LRDCPPCAQGEVIPVRGACDGSSSARKEKGMKVAVRPADAGGVSDATKSIRFRDGQGVRQVARHRSISPVVSVAFQERNGETGSLETLDRLVGFGSRPGA
jgi:hypothetical protein